MRGSTVASAARFEPTARACLLPTGRSRVQRAPAHGIEGYNDYEPERLLIEKKVSGISLIQELRRGRVPIKPIDLDWSKRFSHPAAEIPREHGCVAGISIVMVLSEL